MVIMKTVIKPSTIADGALRQEGDIKPQIVAFLRRPKEQLAAWDTTQIARAFGTTFTYVAQCASEEGLELPKATALDPDLMFEETNYVDVASVSAPVVTTYVRPSIDKTKLFNFTGFGFITTLKVFLFSI